MVLENGPFVLQKNKLSMQLNDNAWNKKANLLYIESPGGVMMD
jgi:serine carboxypeptidase-like clade II